MDMKSMGWKFLHKETFGEYFINRGFLFIIVELGVSFVIVQFWAFFPTIWDQIRNFWWLQ
jgi:hypothetical protein